MAIVYGSILQSWVVVPEILNGQMSFSEMVDQNFTFLNRYPPDIKSFATASKVRLEEAASSDKLNSLDFLRNEITLGEALEAYDTKDVGNLGSILLEANQNNRKVIVSPTSWLGTYKKIIKSLGRNVIVGKENFFAIAYYWRFFVEKQWMLLETLEWMKAAGLVDPFLKETEKVAEKWVVDHATTKMSLDGKDSGVGFSDDSVSAEAFLLLVYCMSACAVFGLTSDIVLPALTVDLAAENAHLSVISKPLEVQRRNLVHRYIFSWRTRENYWLELH